LLPHTDRAFASLESRRLMDNWRPLAGNPYLRDVDTPSARLLVGVDRGRDVHEWSLACSVEGSGAATDRDVDTAEARVLRSVVSSAPRDAFVVVDDAFAEHIAAASARPGPLVVVRRDLAMIHVLDARGYPCSGDIIVLTRHPRDLPQRLMGLPVLAQDDVGDGTFRIVLQRALTNEQR
jgi:hypothetical protein